MNGPVREQSLPLYGLAESFTGERWIEGEGWDLNTITHSLGDTQEDLIVGVDRRTTAQHAKGASRVAISEDLARRSVATALVVDLPNIGNDVFDIAAEVARDDDAWRMREARVDGETVTGHEREYEGMWIFYYLTPTLIVYVLAPVALRPDAVELRRLEPSEVAQRRDGAT